LDAGGLIEHAMPHEERVRRISDAFHARYGRPPAALTEAPGRVNLIGEHVDYNDGLVLPFAIERSVICAWAPRDDDAVCAYSLDFDEHARFDLRGIGHAGPGAWSNYVRGVALAIAGAHPLPHGLDLAIAGDVPLGAGLSSSAAIEVAVAAAFRDAYALPIDGVTLARLCQRAENEFVGVQSGIMDQFASALSRADHALLIDCRSLAYRPVPLPLTSAGLAIVIANSAVRRQLAASAYNERRRECADAVALLAGRLGRGIRSLRDVSHNDLESAQLSDVLLRRARHVVSEIARVAAAADALERGDFTALGGLMRESHLSLRNDYEVSSAELDLLAGLATAQDYVLGARLTGAGFGGCTVNLVAADAVPSFATDVIAPYRARTGLPATMYVTTPQAGLRALQRTRS